MLTLKTEQQLNPSIFEHPLKEQHHRDIELVATEIYEIARVHQGAFICCSGTMGAGKTAILKLVSTALCNENFPVYHRYLIDNRGDVNNPIFTRTNIKSHPGVNIGEFPFKQGAAIISQEIFEGVIATNSVLFISEAQFSGSEHELITLIDVAKSHNITIICDCLSTWYTGIPISETNLLKNLAGEYSFEMQACDTFNSEKRANIPMRGVRIYEDGSLHDSLDATTAHYYISLGQKRLKEIFESARSDLYSQRLSGMDSNGEYVIVPSHPVHDEPFVPGGDERYFPTNLNTCIEICQRAKLVDLAGIYSNILEECEGAKIDPKNEC